MKQTWSDLLFLHVTADPANIQELLPDGLTVDTFPDETGEEKAWVGLVTFRMSGVRFVGTPAFPGLSAFPEFNVRTYVHQAGKDPGVWFFSLDAANPIACQVARTAYHLPYHESTMRCLRNENHVEYSSRRWKPSKAGPVDVRASCDVGRSLGSATPGTLDFFLAERYLLYAYRRNRLFKGLVHHTPYPLNEVDAYQCEETLLAASEIPAGPWVHKIFSPGVTVDVYGLT